jgi:2-polyprenyl-3-methyl-5-hydroxy-6-metoxy-1,4-benzoquinol methylase
LIDVGCGSGYFLDLARNGGFDVLGIEPFPAEAKHARELYNVDVVSGDSALRDLEPRYDVATMWNVLEHSRNPVELVTEVGRVLRPGGVVLIEVPNMLLWRYLVPLRRWLGTKGPGLILYEHINHFTPRSLTAVLRQAGFKRPTFHFTSSISAQRGFLASATTSARKLVASSRIPALNIYFPIVVVAHR